jgi:DNA-directed RNA polymerase specialized sigma24 family protein
MPRNPQAAARQRAARCQANYVKAKEALTRVSAQRKEAMRDCVEAGITQTETGRIFGVSVAAVGLVLKGR